jgi:hypothetical protein
MPKFTLIERSQLMKLDGAIVDAITTIDPEPDTLAFCLATLLVRVVLHENGVDARNYHEQVNKTARSAIMLALELAQYFRVDRN